jgi:uncharacterized protein YndB with AHSA1/START domain
VAGELALNAKYLRTLWHVLSGSGTSDHSQRGSFALDDVRRRWRSAHPQDAPKLAAEIRQAQQALWKFNSIGHIGREAGPTCWMEPVLPVAREQQVRVKFPPSTTGEDVTIYLAVSDLGDGNDQDLVVWQRPRIEFASGGPTGHVLLRDVRRLTRHVLASFAVEHRKTRQYLDALIWARESHEPLDRIAKARGLHARLLANWAAWIGFGRKAQPEITGHFTERLERVQNYDAINGWGSHQTPSLLTNRSDDPISFLTLTVPARGVTVHPSPALESLIAWRSPCEGSIRVAGLVADADGQCGNGVAWRLELHSASGTTTLAHGIIDNGHSQRFAPAEVQSVRPGDYISLAVNPRDGNHGCDTTHIELRINEVDGSHREWDLAREVVDNVLVNNPLSDSLGNAAVWHFYSSGTSTGNETAIPPGSALANWRTAVVEGSSPDAIDRWANAVQNVLTITQVDELTEADKSLRQPLTDWHGPLQWVTFAEDQAVDIEGQFGLDPAMFGRLPDGSPIDPDSMCLHAPQILAIRLPAKLVAGAEFVSQVALHAESGWRGSVQVRVMDAEPDHRLGVSMSAPILIGESPEVRSAVETAMAEFRNLFPPALCYARIVPVDEVVTLTLFYREDEHLQRLMLDDQQSATLNRLWDELYYVSQEPLALTVAFEQIAEFATQDRPDLVKAFAPLKKPINDRADLFRERLVASEPEHMRGVLDFAQRAWRRSLTEAERDGLRSFYQKLRDAEIQHEEAIRLTLARVLASPAFLYKLEQPAAGSEPAPVSNDELAARLSYFLWSSLPDDELRQVARSQRLTNDRELLAQTRRMLADPRVRRLAIQFGCQWLGIRNFDKNDDKNETLFPEFATLRNDMYEENVRFWEDLFRHDGSMLGLIDADHTFLNETLARHYGIDHVSGAEWRRVDGMRAHNRGGVLGMATVLASQSGASRTSPILRGNWVSETLLGERLPRPPANVPQLPDTVPSGLTERQLIEQHSSVAACAKCHAKIDPYGFALEQYDAIGRLRQRAVDCQTTLADGTIIDGMAGLRDYLANDRRDDVIQQFCYKLLGYALGREVQLSDEPFVTELRAKLAANGFRIGVAVESIVTSPQFREIRGGALKHD